MNKLDHAFPLLSMVLTELTARRLLKEVNEDYTEFENAVDRNDSAIAETETRELFEAVKESCQALMNALAELDEAYKYFCGSEENPEEEEKESTITCVLIR